MLTLMPFGLNRTVLDAGCTRVDHPKRYRRIFFSTVPCHAMHISSFFLFLPLISSFSVSRFESASFDCSYCNKDRDGDTSYFFLFIRFYADVMTCTHWSARDNANASNANSRTDLLHHVYTLVLLILLLWPPAKYHTFKPNEEKYQRYESHAIVDRIVFVNRR